MATDIYAMPDMTKKVRQRDGDRGQRDGDRGQRDGVGGQIDGLRGQRGDIEDSGQLEVRGETEEREVNIYESVDDLGLVPGPQQVTTENLAERHTRGRLTKAVRRPLIVVTVCLGVLCFMLLGAVIGLTVHYNSVNNNLTEENYQLQRRVNQLTGDPVPGVSTRPAGTGPAFVSIERCGAIQKNTDGDVTQGPMSLTYQCADYYKLEGTATVVCYDIGHWSPIPTSNYCNLDTSQNPSLQPMSKFMRVGEHEWIQCHEHDPWGNVRWAQVWCRENGLEFTRCEYSSNFIPKHHNKTGILYVK